eukprot:SAG31_NODE_4262_length_3402_cov_12.222222_3_plen_83_part_00
MIVQLFIIEVLSVPASQHMYSCTISISIPATAGRYRFDSTVIDNTSTVPVPAHALPGMPYHEGAVQYMCTRAFQVHFKNLVL